MNEPADPQMWLRLDHTDSTPCVLAYQKYIRFEWNATFALQHCGAFALSNV